MAKVKVRLKVGVAGELGGVDCPARGSVVELSPDEAAVWVDGERAELLEPEKAPKPKAAKPRPAKKRAARKRTARPRGKSVRETTDSAGIAARETASVEPPEKAVEPQAPSREPAGDEGDTDDSAD